MPPALVSIVGTTTSVRDCDAIPREKSMRSIECGVTSNVASQFTIPTASWLAARARRIPSATSTSSATPSLRAFARSIAARPAVITAIDPR